MTCNPLPKYHGFDVSLALALRRSQKRSTFSTRIMQVTLILRYIYRDHRLWVSGVYINFKIPNTVFKDVDVCICVCVCEVYAFSYITIFFWKGI